MGLRAPVLLDTDFRVATAYDAGGTPMAVLVDAQGNIASGVAAGAQEVWALTRDLPKQGSANGSEKKTGAKNRPNQKNTKKSRQSGRSSQQ